MKPLIKFEAIMWVALFGLLAILGTEMHYMPLHWAWFAKALLLAVPGAGVFVVLVLMFAAMTRVDPEDLWDSWWFKYMHRIWGTNFGGDDWRGFLCIDLCRAFWLSFFTAICWIVNLATWAFFSYGVYNSATLEFFQHTSAKDLGSDIGLAACVSIALGLIGFGISAGLLQNTRIACRPGMMLCVVPSAILFAVFLIIIPLHFISVAAYFLWMGGVVGGAVITIAIIAAIVFVLIKTIPLAGSTIVSVLSSGMMRSWKEKTCVMIYSEKQEEQKQSKDGERNISEQ